jgi:hypothetical protein
MTLKLRLSFNITHQLFANTSPSSCMPIAVYRTPERHAMPTASHRLLIA